MLKKSIYGRFTGIILTLTMLLSLVVAPATFAEGEIEQSFHLSVMHMNDTHAHVEPMSRMITAIKETRKNKPEALLLHGGDVMSGTLYFNKHKGQADVALMNLMGIDAMVFGNHEFDLGAKENGQKTLSEFVKAANFPLLGTNINFSNDPFMKDLIVDGKAVENATSGKAYHSIVKEVNGERIGIFGLTTEDTAKIASPEQVTFSNYIASAKEAVAEFERLGINKIISINHIGFNSDPSVGNDLLLAAHVKGIDIIVGGHSHTKLEKPVLVTKNAEGQEKDPTVIVQAHQYANYLGTVDVEFDQNGVVIGHEGELLEVSNYDEDAEAVEVLKPFKDEVDKLANEEIGAKALKDLLSPRQTETGYESVRATETELGNLITDAMLAKAQEKFPKTVIAMQNGGGIRAPILAGDIKTGDVISVLPFGNDPVKAELTGAEIKEVLEHSVRNAPKENGGFLHVSGMKFTYDSDKEIGNRVQTMEVKIDNKYETIVEAEKYIITTNSFTGQGGDGFKTFTKAYEDGRVMDIGEIDWEQLANYMHEEKYLNGEVNPDIEGRIIDLARNRVSLMHMNDTHAHVEPMLRMITAIKEFRTEKPEALLLHAGDVFSGTMYFNEFKGQADLALLNLMGIDAMVFGNHEFDLGANDNGHQSLSEFVKGANFPLLGSNIDFSKDAYMKDLVVAKTMIEKPDPGKSYHSIVKEVKGEKVGIFGLTTEDTQYISSPIAVGFKDYLKTAEEAVAEFKKQGISKIIAVTHIGLDSDPSVGNDMLLAKVDGIDIIVGGHSHTKLEEPIVVDTNSKGQLKDPTVIVQAFQYSQFLGTLDVDFDDNGVVVGHSGKLLEVEKFEADPEASETLKEYSGQVEEVMNKKSGAVALKDLLNPRQNEPGDDSVRANETELGNLVTDAMLAKAKLKEPDTVIAIQNGGGIRQDIKKGEITIGEIISVLPFGNNPVVVNLSGAEIKNILEHSVRNAPAENGGFLHVAGMKFIFDSHREIGNRVLSIEVNVNGEFIEMNPKEFYMVTTNAFTGKGGDGFETLSKAHEDGRVRDIGENDWEQLLNYMVEDLKGQVDPIREGRITDLKGEEPKPGTPDPETDVDKDGDGDKDEVEIEEDKPDPEKPSIEDQDKEGGVVDNTDSQNGDKLPKTATNIFTYMMIGSILLVIGLGFMLYRNIRFKKNHH